jgi:hypothetical protein
LSFADALVGALRVVFVGSLAGSNAAGFIVFIIGLLAHTPAADALDDVVSCCAITLARIVVVDLVGSTLVAAYELVDVVELSGRAGGTEVVNQVESWLADASADDPVFILVADGGAHSVAALTAHFLVSVYAVAALVGLVVYLGRGVALRAATSDQVVAGKAATGPDGWVPHFVEFAGSSADSVG